AVNKARLQQVTAELELQDSKKSLYSTIENYWEQAVTSQQKFIAARENVSSREASFELLREQFDLGLKNVVELMTSKSNLLQAQQSMLQSKYTAILNIQMLRFYQRGQ
ncbi:MAG: TolC family protein, partial [Bacteroidaceae bacterium]|nr:TolC family protein [Bacteroidaceae bacterium]